METRDFHFAERRVGEVTEMLGIFIGDGPTSQMNLVPKIVFQIGGYSLHCEAASYRLKTQTSSDDSVL